MSEEDTASIFSYDGEGDPDTFSINQLKFVVNSHFNTTVCNLQKLAEGGYHKVYEILQNDPTAPLKVVRVAAPAFPRDKLESEVATLKFIATHTQVPVPKVYAWNSDASNPAGVEYMIMEKVPGISAGEIWDTLSETVKENVVSQVAEHLMALFTLRFDRIGSLYLSPPPDSEIIIGPIISRPFYRALDGEVRIPDADSASYYAGLSGYRGPFLNTSDYLQSFLRSELYFVVNHRPVALKLLSQLFELDDEAAVVRLELGERVTRKALELCSIYPGDIPLHTDMHPTISSKQFSLCLNDFRLSNIMIEEESGRVTGIIDLEGTTVAPLWECALLPRWLQDPNGPESSFEGGSAESRQRLRALFMEKAGNPEWNVFYEYGRPFRELRERIGLQLTANASDEMEAWVDERLSWAKDHPGIGFPDEFWEY